MRYSCRVAVLTFASCVFAHGCGDDDSGDHPRAIDGGAGMDGGAHHGGTGGSGGKGMGGSSGSRSGGSGGSSSSSTSIECGDRRRDL